MQQADSIADTSVVVHFLRGDVRAREVMEPRRIAVTFITWAELSVGVLKANKPQAAARSVQRFLLNLPMAYATEQTVVIYAQTFVDLQRRGAMIPVNDIWIAALALEHALPLLARDKHFLAVQGLRIIEC